MVDVLQDTIKACLYANGVYLPVVEFVRLPTFEKSVSRLLSESDIFELELTLLINPRAGDVIPGAKGLRKLRRPASGRGKRGGARVIYYVVTTEQKILLIYAYAKNAQGDLSPAQAKQFAQLIHQEFP